MAGWVKDMSPALLLDRKGRNNASNSMQTSTPFKQEEAVRDPMAMPRRGPEPETQTHASISPLTQDTTHHNYHTMGRRGRGDTHASSTYPNKQSPNTPIHSNRTSRSYRAKVPVHFPQSCKKKKKKKKKGEKKNEKGKGDTTAVPTSKQSV